MVPGYGATVPVGRAAGKELMKNPVKSRCRLCIVHKGLAGNCENACFIVCCHDGKGGVFAGKVHLEASGTSQTTTVSSRAFIKTRMFCVFFA